LHIDKKALELAYEAARMEGDTPRGPVGAAIEEYLRHAEEWCPYDCDGCHMHCRDEPEVSCPDHGNDVSDRFIHIPS